ncbi:hypothetical protein YC2023_024741 [Brassica napus]
MKLCEAKTLGRASTPVIGQHEAVKAINQQCTAKSECLFQYTTDTFLLTRRFNVHVLGSRIRTAQSQYIPSIQITMKTELLYKLSFTFTKVSNHQYKEV